MSNPKERDVEDSGEKGKRKERKEVRERNEGSGCTEYRVNRKHLKCENKCYKKRKHNRYINHKTKPAKNYNEGNSGKALAIEHNEQNNREADGREKKEKRKVRGRRDCERGGRRRRRNQETRGINSDERGRERPRRASVYSVLRSTTTQRDQVFMLRQPGAPRTPGCAPPTGGWRGVRVEVRRERWGGVEG